ncbi:hypothetical protein ACFU96_43415 [Streptomyces sp. NPDC057620]|uniref:hypothetical protein n=1 Tax=Streptomyces sp. NPDC057620 TaxID=3346185 RepID=UPI0036BE329E
MGEPECNRVRWGDMGVLHEAVSGAPRVPVSGYAIGAAVDDTAERAGGAEVRVRVEYRVTGQGVIELNYSPTGQEGDDGVDVDGPDLPWSKEVVLHGPIAIPVLGVTLDEDGGRAELTVLVDGHESARVVVTWCSATGVCVAGPVPGEWDAQA